MGRGYSHQTTSPALGLVQHYKDGGGGGEGAWWIS